MSLKSLGYSCICLVSVFALTCCEKSDNAALNDLSKKILVEGYVFANEPVEHVKISQINGNGISTGIPVQTATVKVTQNGIQIPLELKDASLGIYAQTDSIVFIGGEGAILLEISFSGNKFAAETLMPQKIHNLAIDQNTITVIPQDTSLTVATLTWNEVPTYNGYCIFIRSTEDNAAPIGNAGSGNSNPFLIVNASNTVQLKSSHFPVYGAYTIYVTAINSEYYDVYGYGNSPSPGISRGNIDGGWGVFTAFNGQSVSVQVQ